LGHLWPYNAPCQVKPFQTLNWLWIDPVRVTLWERREALWIKTFMLAHSGPLTLTAPGRE